MKKNESSVVFVRGLNKEAPAYLTILRNSISCEISSQVTEIQIMRYHVFFKRNKLFRIKHKDHCINYLCEIK